MRRLCSHQHHASSPTATTTQPFMADAKHTNGPGQGAPAKKDSPRTGKPDASSFLNGTGVSATSAVGTGQTPSTTSNLVTITHLKTLQQFTTAPHPTATGPSHPLKATPHRQGTAPNANTNKTNNQTNTSQNNPTHTPGHTPPKTTQTHHTQHTPLHHNKTTAHTPTQQTH